MSCGDADASAGGLAAILRSEMKAALDEVEQFRQPKNNDQAQRLQAAHARYLKAMREFDKLMESDITSTIRNS
jgi:hypothetical protein